jgi:hypothetical protein
VAAAHLLRYSGDERVGESLREAGEIRWLVCRPPAPYWPDAIEAGHALAAACVAPGRLRDDDQLGPVADRADHGVRLLDQAGRVHSTRPAACCGVGRRRGRRPTP